MCFYWLDFTDFSHETGCFSCVFGLFGISYECTFLFFHFCVSHFLYYKFLTSSQPFLIPAVIYSFDHLETAQQTSYNTFHKWVMLNCSAFFFNTRPLPPTQEILTISIRLFYDKWLVVFFERCKSYFNKSFLSSDSTLQRGSRTTCWGPADQSSTW